MPPELTSILNDVVKVVNHIKAHALNSRLFGQLCEEMDTEHRHLLLYTEIRITRTAAEISPRKKVTADSTFQ